ncbi:unnamed protein product [Gordionus sp. m RMFG-2023]
MSILIPIVYLPIPILYPSQSMKCAYVSIVTATYLITQALPLAVASLVPLVLFPIFSIMSLKDVSSHYLKDPIMLFFASLVIAQAIETVNLHRRLALNLLYLSGSKPIWLLLGFLGTTFFISMWINNTATSALMTPIACGVMEEFKRIHALIVKGADKVAFKGDHRNSQQGIKGRDSIEKNNQQPMENIAASSPLVTKGGLENRTPNNGSISLQLLRPSPMHYRHPRGLETTTDSHLNIETLNPKENSEDSSTRFSFRYQMDESLVPINKAIFIAVAYAANLGGTASLTGTGPNLIMTGLMTQLFGEKAQVSFDKWLLYSFPGAFIILILMWIFLGMYFFGIRQTYREICTNKKNQDAFDARPYIKVQLNNLGRMKDQEIAVASTFVLLIFIWVLKKPRFIPGWQSFFKDDYVNDTTPALILAILYFIMPTDFSTLKLNLNRDEEKEPNYIPYKPILTWERVQVRLLWDIIFLFGGGMAIAAGFKASGLSQTLVDSFGVFKNYNPILIVLIFIIFTSFITELLSNISTASILVPLMSEMAVSLKVHPHYFVFPVTLASSYSFMLPIATGPNAIVFTAGNLSFWDMLKPGFVVNFIGILVSFCSINSYAKLVLGTDKYPDWAIRSVSNKTIIQ